MNHMDIVFDASTLILLAKIDLLRIVAERYSIIIPDKVKAEALVADSSDAMAIRYLLDSTLIRAMYIKNRRNFEKFVTDFRIHDGEAEALCLALELSAPVAVDDGPAIKASKIMGLQFITAIHFVINCVQTGAINQAVAIEKLKKLSIVGRYRLQIIQDAEKRISGGIS
jgi:predicted nucleic acid-binding protein